MYFKNISPFEPRNPVKPENLEGRQDIINDYLHYIKLAVNGNPQHFFINGVEGIGKSSVASYLMEYSKIKYNMIGVHVYNNGVNSMDDLINNIVECLLNEIKNESLSEKILNAFSDYIENVGFLGNSISFKPDDVNVTENIRDSFPYFIVDLINSFKDKKGLFIILDDINGLSETSYFANWYKSFADTLSTNFNCKIPLVIMLTSHPKAVKALYNHNHSFNRIFVYRTIKALDKSEVKDFFIKMFESENITVDDDALELMVEFSAGVPVMMQEIGDGVYWLNNENKISKDIALKGIEYACSEIELRYLQPILHDFKMTNDDLSILMKLGNDFLNNSYNSYSFKKEDIS